MQITLKDVAKRAGVTVTTVSRMLNKRGYVSEKTKEKILSAMKELHYQPNELARSLSKQRTSMIGVIVPSIQHPFFAKVVHYIEYYAAERGYKTLVCNSNRQRDKEIGYIEMLKSHKVEGIVMCSRTPGIGRDLTAGTAVVSFERTISDHIPAISCDNYQGGTLATNHLIDCGCRNLVICGGSRDIHLPADQRTESFLAVSRERGVQAKAFPTEEAQFETRDYTGYIENILEQNPGTDGIFATSDVMAAQVIQVCARLGKRIPADIQLVGFDDVELAELTLPKLSTVHQPVDAMCEYSVDAIIRQAAGELVPKTSILPTSLIQRDSTSISGITGSSSPDRF